MRNKYNQWTSVILFSLAILQIGFGLWLLLTNKGTVGVDGLTQKLTAFGGEFYIFIGAFFLFVGYFSLSPFSKFRGFLERRRKK